MSTENKTGAVAKVATNPKEEKSQGLTVIKPIEKMLTVEDRFANAKSFNSLVEKYNKIKETKITLTHFTVSADKHTCSLHLSDEEGNTFYTRNPVLIAEVLKLSQKTVDEQLNIAEKEALGFAV